MNVENGHAAHPRSLCTIHPYFTILDEAEARDVIDEFVARSRTEAGCVHYGWTKVGDKLFCREGYTDGDAVLAHLGNVGSCIGKLLARPCKLDRIEFHGPAVELEKLKETAANLGAALYAHDSGVQRYEKA
mmetsp:Transcript_33814/g.110556  ORF Transcript_33814/g.110556 Transcript_33814/m.110556 type:complete len:131 (-) Transcript_33814:468-860(-)